MIDRVKIMISDYSPIEDNPKIKWDWLDKTIPTNPNKTFQKAKIFNSKFKRKSHSLKLLLTADEMKDEFSLSISGSLRKWYYQDNSRKDLNYSEFNDCISLLARELGMWESQLWNGKVTKLEVGVTLMVSEKFKNIADCFVRYRNSEREEVKTTVYLHFKNYKLVIYDKYAEMNKRKNLDKYPYNKVNELFYFPRLELVLNKVSGVEFFKKKASTLREIEENWDGILSKFPDYFKKINFVNVLSKENGLREISSYSDFKKFLIYESINNFGLAECLECLNHTGILSSNKTFAINDLMEIYKSFKVKDDELKVEFFNLLEKKINRLYNKSNIE